MKKLLILFALISALFSCNKADQPDVIPEDTPEEILIAVQNTYTVSSITDKGQQYQFIFANVTPLSLKKEYPVGIPSLVINKSSISEMTDDGKNIEISFTSGNRAVLTYDSWLQVEFRGDEIVFSDDKSTGQITFLVKETKSEDIRVTVSGHEGFSTVQTDYDRQTRSGTVSFQCTSSEYFVKTVSIEVSNEKQSVRQEVSLSRVNFKFADGTTSKSFDFQDYERYFEIGLSNADKTVSVVVPSESSGWIKARMSNENVNGVDQTTVCILLSGNIGKEVRKSRVLVRKEGYSQDLTIDISQIGNATEGSFTRALAAFHESLNGSSWVCSENWCSDRPLFEWFGISASRKVSKEQFGEQGTVYFGTDDRWSLDLSANNMRGEISQEFWKACRCFESIRISSEYLPTSTVPECVWHDNLVSLDLSLSFMNVPLGSYIRNAGKLVGLDISCCNVNGPIPDAICELGNLRRLCLRECGITGAIPASLGQMASLEELYLNHNMEMGGNLPDGFYNLTTLRCFDISATKVGGQLSKSISNLANLEEFAITGCEFTGTIPEEFGTLKKLSNYDLDGNYFTHIPEFVRYFGFDASPCKVWVGSAGFPLGVPYHQRSEKDGRPENYIVKVEDAFSFEEILVDGQPLKRPGYYVDFELCHELPFPVWANIKYGMYTWSRGYIDQMKYPVYPLADDLQYPGDEYYYDGSEWRHPKLQYPAREYVHDGTAWVHDPSCPWDKEYVDSHQGE